MGLLPKSNVVRSGSIRFEGREIIDLSGDDLRALWGTEMAMVFQDPMTSLNPVMKIGKQITGVAPLSPRRVEVVREGDPSDRFPLRSASRNPSVACKPSHTSSPVAFGNG